MASTAETISDLAATSSADQVSEHLQDGASAAPVPVPEASDNRGDEPGRAVPEEEAGVLEHIASTGKFWHNWDKLKIILSSKLKQVRRYANLFPCNNLLSISVFPVLSEYPEVKMTSEEQKASLGETYPDLVKRLDDALHSFVDGPPFTLQRLCEILLAARSIYPNLSKLALALEKNLLVTSTLTACTDPCPLVTQKQDEPEEASLKQQQQQQQQPSNSEENGVQPTGTDGDEVMAEVETDIGDEMTVDMEAFEAPK
ncbi:Serine/threonine-protein phosphatase 4 regulatory subunit 2 [Linum perenne]